MSTVVWLSLFLWLSVDLRKMPVGEAARILAVETVADKSSVLRSLTDAGQTVTVFTPFLDGDRINYTEVDTSRYFPMKFEMDVMQTIREFGDPVVLMDEWSRVVRIYCDAIYGNQKLADLIASEARHLYDLLLIKPLGLDCVSYLANALDLPVIYSIPSPSGGLPVTCPTRLACPTCWPATPCQAHSSRGSPTRRC